MSHFVQYIWDNGSTVNYDTAYNKVAYEYFFKVFYNKTNKKEYESQIRQYNVHYINIILMKDIIISEKVRVERKSYQKVLWIELHRQRWLEYI